MSSTGQGQGEDFQDFEVPMVMSKQQDYVRYLGYEQRFRVKYWPMWLWGVDGEMTIDD